MINVGLAQARPNKCSLPGPKDRRSWHSNTKDRRSLRTKTKNHCSHAKARVVTHHRIPESTAIALTDRILSLVLVGHIFPEADHGKIRSARTNFTRTKIPVTDVNFLKKTTNQITLAVAAAALASRLVLYISDQYGYSFCYNDDIAT